MSAAENKQLVQTAFQALALGNTRPYLDLLDDDFSFTITGHNAWSRTISGKANVRAELYGPLFEQFADRYTAQVVQIVAEGDAVIVEYRGCVTTKRGQLYNNEYCLVLRMENGKVKSLREYADSDLVARVLEPPPWLAAGEAAPA